jgi:hypothetical protein
MGFLAWGICPRSYHRPVIENVDATAAERCVGAQCGCVQQQQRAVGDREAAAQARLCSVVDQCAAEHGKLAAAVRLQEGPHGNTLKVANVCQGCNAHMQLLANWQVLAPAQAHQQATTSG